MDFNTQRRIVKALEERGKKNFLLFLPCLAAKYIIIAVLSAARAADVALSDSKGRFLGIERSKKKRRVPYERELREMNALSAQPNAQDIQNEIADPGYVYDYVPRKSSRPFWMRAVSGLLAAAFAFMLFPELSLPVSAQSTADNKIIVPNMEQITTAALAANGISSSDLAACTELNLSANYQSSADNAVNIDSGTFWGMPYLTTITLGYSDGMSVGSYNFSNIAPNATVFVTGLVSDDDGSKFSNLSNKLRSANSNLTVLNDNGLAKYYSNIPANNVTGLEAYSGVGKAVLEWDYTSGADGYYIYTYDPLNNKFNSPGIALSRADLTSGNTSSKFHYEISSSAEARYGVQAYKDTADGIRLRSKTIALTDNTAVAKEGSNLTLSGSMNNLDVTLTLTENGKSMADYYVIYSKQGEGAYIRKATISPSDFTNSVYEYSDDVPFSVDYPRSYIAVAFYDPLSQTKTNPVYPDSVSNTALYSVFKSNIVDFFEAKMNPPANLRYTDNTSSNAWSIAWERPNNTSGISVKYKVYLNGALYKDGLTQTYINIPFTGGSDVTVAVTAYADTISESEKCELTIPAAANSVVLNSVKAGNTTATLNWNAYAGAKYYTVKFTRADGTSNSITVGADDKNAYDSKTKTYTCKVTGLQNDNSYTFSVKADNAKYYSAEKTVTPSAAPQPPQKVFAEAMENSALITWDPVEYDPTGELVDGYYVTVRYKAGGEAAADKVSGQNQYTAQNLENDQEYYAEVTSYVILSDGTEITGTSSAVSDYFKPTVSVDDVLTLSVSASGLTIKLSWTPVKNATKYILTKKSSQGTTTLDMGTKTTYDDKEVIPEVEYTYGIIAQRTVDGTTYESEQAVTQSITPHVTLDSYASGLTATGSDGAITLKWDKTSGASGYFVQYTDVGSDQWNELAAVTGTEYVHTGLSNGTTYKYRVIPYVLLYNGDKAYNQSALTQSGGTQMGTAGTYFAAPLDLTADTGDNSVTLKWSAVEDADGYQVCIRNYIGDFIELDRVTKNTAIHTGIPSGTTLTYAVRAFKEVSGQLVYGDYSIPRTVTVGVYLSAPTDVTATAGDAKIDLKWTAVSGAEGYVVYSYNSANMAFAPVGIVSKNSFSHTGLVNGYTYTYMIAAYKTVDGETKYSSYSLAVSGVPQGKTSSTSSKKDDNSSVSDYRIYITGTAPSGMSNTNVISAFAENGAFDTDIDLRFSVNGFTVTSVQNVLEFYGQGLESFIIFPFDISLYEHDTDKAAEINPGYYVTVTVPVPDMMLGYLDDITVIHVSDYDTLEILPMTRVEIAGVECVQFTASDFSPFALVVYAPDAVEDMSSGEAQPFVGSEGFVQSGFSAVLRCTYLPELYSRRKRNRIYRKKAIR